MTVLCASDISGTRYKHGGADAFILGTSEGDHTQPSTNTLLTESCLHKLTTVGQTTRLGMLLSTSTMSTQSIRQQLNGLMKHWGGI